MKILYITPSIPNNFSRVRTLNLIKSFKISIHCEILKKKEEKIWKKIRDNFGY